MGYDASVSTEHIVHCGRCRMFLGGTLAKEVELGIVEEEVETDRFVLLNLVPVDVIWLGIASGAALVLVGAYSSIGTIEAPDS